MAMMDTDKLISFKKMWTWLSGYPAHDSQYYMQHVAKLDQPWPNGCPLATSDSDDCDGCRPLWYSKKGTLCSDVESPLYKWKATSPDYPDNRSYYASHIAVLAMNALREMQSDKVDASAGKTAKSDYIDSLLHGR
jgi:hypothetical protein